MNRADMEGGMTSIVNGAAALELAAQGFRVFPLKPAGKTPLIRGGRGCLDATTDPEMVQAWWRGAPEAGIGVAYAVAAFALFSYLERSARANATLDVR